MNTTYSPEDKTQGTSRRPCQHCGCLGHEHNRERVSYGNDRHGYNLVCPE